MSAPWDFLREPAIWVGVIEPITLWGLLVVSAILFGISLLALKRKNSSKLKYVAGAFGLFFIKSLFMVVDVYFSPGEFMNNAIVGFFDLLIMVGFFIALFRK